MKILVTGGSGQLGLALQRQTGNHELVAFDRTALDITNAAQVASVFTREQPDAVINCAAWTDVDACESDPEKAMLVNGTAVGILAREAANANAQLVQISTDYVFDGTKESPYAEDDLPNPVSVYGESKLLGEQLAGLEALIIRTSWVMGPDGHNMLKTVLHLLEGSDDLHFVDDQRGCPTFTDDLSGVIISLIEKTATGLIHVTNAGIVSWYQFACEVAQVIGESLNRLHPISTSDVDPPRLAPRPANSALENLRLQDFGVSALPSYSQTLRLALTD
jgi:dTDP-4-dehydrorhamnose reductase